ncbi:MAG: motor neuron and pancreas homeobox protein 1 [Bilophila wadsworthia]
MMAKRLAPVLKAHGVIDEHGAYVAPVFSTPELPPQLGNICSSVFLRRSVSRSIRRCCRRRSPCRVRRGYGGDAAYGFMLGQGADIVTVTLLAQTDWNDDGLNEWLLLCRVKPIIGKNNMRDYYLLVEKPGASILVPKLLAVYDCLSQSCKLFVDVDQKKPPYAPEEPTIEVKIGQKDVTLPPNAPPPPGAPQHEFKESKLGE